MQQTTCPCAQRRRPDNATRADWRRAADAQADTSSMEDPDDERPTLDLGPLA